MAYAAQDSSSTLVKKVLPDLLKDGGGDQATHFLYLSISCFSLLVELIFLDLLLTSSSTIAFKNQTYWGMFHLD